MTDIRAIYPNLARGTSQRLGSCPMRAIPLLLAAAVVAGCDTDAAPPPPKETQVLTVEFSNGADRPLPTLLYVPAAEGRHPVVVFSHGYTRHPEDYDLLFRTWADAGFLVAAPTFPKTARGAADLDIEDLAQQPGDVTAVIDGLMLMGAKKGDPLFGRVDEAKVAAAGHSLGGMTTVGLFSSARDARVSAGIVLAGSARTVGTGYDAPGASILFVHGAQDRVVRPEDGRAAYEPFPGPKAWLSLKFGDHLGPYIATDYEQTVFVATATTDYLRWALLGDASALKRLNSTVDIESKLS